MPVLGVTTTPRVQPEAAWGAMAVAVVNKQLNDEGAHAHKVAMVIRQEKLIARVAMANANAAEQKARFKQVRLEEHIAIGRRAAKKSKAGKKTKAKEEETDGDTVEVKYDDARIMCDTGRIWQYLAVSGGNWPYLAVYGGIWPYMAVYVCIWLSHANSAATQCKSASFFQ